MSSLEGRDIRFAGGSTNVVLPGPMTMLSVQENCLLQCGVTAIGQTWHDAKQNQASLVFIAASLMHEQECNV